jgi:hypothetical protein
MGVIQDAWAWLHVEYWLDVCTNKWVSSMCVYQQMSVFNKLKMLLVASHVEGELELSRASLNSKLSILSLLYLIRLVIRRNTETNPDSVKQKENSSFCFRKRNP